MDVKGLLQTAGATVSTAGASNHPDDCGRMV